MNMHACLVPGMPAHAAWCPFGAFIPVDGSLLGDLRGLLGTGNLIVADGQVAFDQELLVIRIEDRRVDVLAGEAFDRCSRFPQAHRDELGTVTLDPPQQPGAAVAGRALVAFDAGPLHVLRIGGSVFGPDRPAPDSRDHPEYSLYLETAPAGLASI